MGVQGDLRGEIEIPPGPSARTNFKRKLRTASTPSIDAPSPLPKTNFFYIDITPAQCYIVLNKSSKEAQP